MELLKFIEVLVGVGFMVSALWFMCECVREIIRIDKHKYF